MDPSLHQGGPYSVICILLDANELDALKARYHFTTAHTIRVPAAKGLNIRDYAKQRLPRSYSWLEKHVKLHRNWPQFIDDLRCLRASR